MQVEAMTVSSPLDAAMATLNSAAPDEGFMLIEMAQSHADRLKTALDTVNLPEELGQ
jgi:hypothetical protein